MAKYVDLSIPYDAAAKLAYEASDKSMAYDAFKAKHRRKTLSRFRGAGCSENDHNYCVTPTTKAAISFMIHHNTGHNITKQDASIEELDKSAVHFIE
eukprot:8998670-Ditylum_brightwellii.AAC.1